MSTWEWVCCRRRTAFYPTCTSLFSFSLHDTSKDETNDPHQGMPSCCSKMASAFTKSSVGCRQNAKLPKGSLFVWLQSKYILVLTQRGTQRRSNIFSFLFPFLLTQKITPLLLCGPPTPHRERERFSSHLFCTTQNPNPISIEQNGTTNTKTTTRRLKARSHFLPPLLKYYCCFKNQKALLVLVRERIDNIPCTSRNVDANCQAKIKSSIVGSCFVWPAAKLTVTILVVLGLGTIF